MVSCSFTRYYILHKFIAAIGKIMFMDITVNVGIWSYVGVDSYHFKMTNLYKVMLKLGNKVFCTI